MSTISNPRECCLPWQEKPSVEKTSSRNLLTWDLSRKLSLWNWFLVRQLTGSYPSLSLGTHVTADQKSLPGGYIPRVEKERECWKFLDWRLNSENDSRVHGQPSLAGWPPCVLEDESILDFINRRHRNVHPRLTNNRSWDHLAPESFYFLVACQVSQGVTRLLLENLMSKQK